MLSTHSSVFLNRAAGTSSVFLVERAQGASTVRELTGGPSEALTALGVQLSDVLSADRLLVVEGDSDREILTVWFPDLLGNPRVEVAIGRGGDNARFAGIARDLLQAVDRQKSRRLLYLRDRDELSSTALDHLEADPAVYVLQRRELENYLLQDASAIAAALVDRGVVDADEVNSGRVQEVLREGADRLKPTIVLKRIAGELASRRLVDRKLVAELIQQGPSLDRFHAAIADRLPSEGLLDDLTKEWVAAEEDLAATWEERWQELAPGSDVLAYLWRTYGRSYDKLQDGLATARRMQAPTELTDILHRFLTD